MAAQWVQAALSQKSDEIETVRGELDSLKKVLCFGMDLLGWAVILTVVACLL